MIIQLAVCGMDINQNVFLGLKRSPISKSMAFVMNNPVDTFIFVILKTRNGQIITNWMGYNEVGDFL